ncbi:MAG: YoaK family protein [Oscillospiraceae bacterium]
MSDSLITAVFVILSGGYQDAYSYCCRGGVFANAQTGNIVLMSINMFEGKPSSCMKYLIPLVAFLVGIYAAEVIHYKYKDMEKIHWRQIIVLCEIVVLFAVGFMPQSVNAAANAFVPFVCALQLQTFHSSEGMPMQALCASVICAAA